MAATLKSIPAERRALSVEEFLRVYGIGRTTLYAEVAGGRLRVVKCGRRTLIAVEDAEKWFKALAREAAQ